MMEKKIVGLLIHHSYLMRSGYALDDGAAIHFRNEELDQKINPRTHANAFLVERVEVECQEKA